MEGKGKVSAAKHDGFGTEVLHQLPGSCVENRALFISDDTGGCHGDVSLVDLVEILSRRWDDFGRVDAAVEFRFHHSSRTEDGDAAEPPRCYGTADFRNHIYDVQWRNGFEFLNAEVSGDRRDHYTFRTCRNQPVCEAAVDSDLSRGVISGQIAKESGGIGMYDGQLQRDVLCGEG